VFIVLSSAETGSAANGIIMSTTASMPASAAAFTANLFFLLFTIMMILQKGIAL
jgi:hypothetical protein